MRRWRISQNENLYSICLFGFYCWSFVILFCRKENLGEWKIKKKIFRNSVHINVYKSGWIIVFDKLEKAFIDTKEIFDYIEEKL